MQVDLIQSRILDDLSPIPSQGEAAAPKRLFELWPLYTNSHAPTVFDVRMLQKQPTLKMHKAVLTMVAAAKETFFNRIFQISDGGKQTYDVNLDYPRAVSLLEGELEEPAAATLRLISTLPQDSPTVIRAASLVLHDYLEITRGKILKKVSLSICSYALSSINSIRANMVDYFVGFEAVVLKVYQTRLMPLSLQFLCAECKTQQIHYLQDGNYSTPTQCRSSNRRECRSRSFLLKRDSVQMVFVQRVKVQEIDPEGRLPRQVMCELRDRLVGRIITGETVEMYGIVRTETADERDKKVQGIFTPYVLVNSLVQRAGKLQLGYDVPVIQALRAAGNIFGSLIRSYCPAIYGHEIVKAGLLLGLVGGCNKNLNDESTFRETSHVLLLGDPGIGKSQLLKFAVEALPHSIYVNATAATTSGLTVTVNKDHHEHSLEAGALILADNGICAIDEFDKATDMSSLLEVMEQQTVSIAKAGIICQLKCRVGIVASANPVTGCYNQGKSFKDNTKISNAILSRFDLIFLLVDKPDPERDQKLSEHIMKIHNASRKVTSDDGETLRRKWRPDSGEATSLSEKYALLAQAGQCYPLQELKKYLSYVRNQVQPMVTKEALEIIKGFYVALRENSPSNSFQITNRQLESLVRLAMARAKIEGRNWVTEQDAVEVTQLMQESLFDSFDQMGFNINALRNQVKKTKIEKKTGELSLPKQRNLFINALHEAAEGKEQPVWEWSELVKLAKDLQLNIGDFYAFIERLNQDGVLLQKGNKRYALQRVNL